MSGQTVLKRLILITSTVLLITSTTSAYNIDTLGEPYSPSIVGNLSDSVRMVNVTDNGDPVTEEEVENGFTFNYTYNASGGETRDMRYLTDGYWYAEVNPSTDRGSEIDYLLKETGGTQDEFTASETLNFGNYSVELLSDTNDVLPPGETVNVRVNVTDEWNSEPETNANVNVYFTNGSQTHEIQGLNNQDGSEYYNSEVNVPDVFDGRYLMHVNVSNTADSINNSSASFSMPVQTEPPMEGHIQKLRATGACNNNSFFTECERGADISTSYNVTGEVPDQVNLTLNVWNLSNGTWQNRSIIEMDQQNGLYNADLILPELNTTVFGEEVQLVYNATGQETNAVQKRNITIKNYNINFGAASSAQQGGDYNLELVFEKYFSSQPLEQGNIEANVTVRNSTDELSDFTLEDMNYEDGVYQRDVQIGSEWEEGTYTVEVEAWNIYNEQKSAEDSFFVEDVNRTFNISGDIEDKIITGKNYSYNFTVENLGSSELELESNSTGEIKGFTWVNGGEIVNIPADSTVDVTAKFNMTEVVERNGEIFLSDNAYNDSIDVDLDIPDCDYRNETYCIEVESDELNASADEPGYESNFFTVYYLASENSSEELTPQVEGNLSDHTIFDPESQEMNSTNNQQIFDINYSVSEPGYFKGTMNVGTVSVPISLNSNIELQEITFEAPSSIELGTLPETDTVNEEIEIENTGSIDIEAIRFSSDEMDVTAESSEINAGSSETFNLEISSLSSSASIQITAEAGDQTTEQSIDVSANVVTDYSEEASSLRDRINRLQSRVSSNENLNKLNTASLNVTELENAYQAEEYEKAERIYEATEQQVSLVESRSSTGTGGQNQEETQSSDPSGTERTSSSQGGGSMLPIIAAVVFILLIIGFITYTSLIPEEGDPLYKVLG